MDEINPNIICNVCGENEFEEREGFYYCQECGTKQDQIRQIEIEREDNFNEGPADGGLRSKTIKLKNVKVEKPQLTSWECYNYILRGYVEELLAFGAKEELKLMTLQIWAAYLRRMEVAFFSRKHADLPKLGVRYLMNDALTIYNHSRGARKKRKRKRGDETSCTSDGEDICGRNWRKSKRKLDESIYSSITSVTATSATQATSTSGNSNKAIRLAFNMKARKILKKRMPVKHLLRHEMDAEGLLECHKQPKSTELKRGEHSVMVMNLKQIYSILAMALNLISDDIQLTDLVRFIQEGHIGWKNVLQYFPENVASKELLKNIDFYRHPEKYLEKTFRGHVCLLSKSIGIKNFKTPNMIALVRRYVTELCLPQEIQTYVERLINFLPPRFHTRCVGFYPAYEARAMAYIIFTLKLLFGLDDYKEKKISNAAKKLNHKIRHFNRTYLEDRKLLFVWDEWVQYIEMRKVIVSHFNPAFCKQFQQCESTAQILEQMSDDVRKREEEEQTSNEKVPQTLTKENMDKIKTLLEGFLENYNQDATQTDNTLPKIEFKATYTPGFTYFKSILLHCDNANETAFKIPHYMRTDHAERDMRSYLEVKPLIEYFKNKGKELNVSRLETNKNRNYVGIFRAPRYIYRGVCSYQASFDITDEEWQTKVAAEIAVNTDDLEWKTNLEAYADRYFKEQKRNIRRYNEACRNMEGMDNNSDAGITIRDFTTPNAEIRTTYSRNINNSNIVVKKEPTRSIEVFSENNMDPLQSDIVSKPRRDLERINIFADIESEDDLFNNDNVSFTNHSCANETISSRETSPVPEPIITTDGIPIKSEFIPETSSTQTADEQNLHFHTSNMDCWMIFGSITMLAKLQRNQLQDKFPLNFFWLLETCAQTLGVEWSVVYEQLLVIELMYCVGIEDVDKVENCVYLNYLNPIKDYQMVVNAYRDIW